MITSKLRKVDVLDNKAGVGANKAINPTPQRRPVFAKEPQKQGDVAPRVLVALKVRKVMSIEQESSQQGWEVIERYWCHL